MYQGLQLPICALSAPCPTCTCHDVFHHRNKVGRLAEGGRVVVLILEGKHTDQCVSEVLGQLSKVGTKGQFGLAALRTSGLWPLCLTSVYLGIMKARSPSGRSC